ncbi:MAG: sulfite exporter TauE/SafE family protein [Candidatus Rokubacteria bacterium]|nr:sulfite exporter TauE/SafE family protein [Candidatus Rokubacteria bacterium]MBI2527416.1 sulfite exporter TauE/SafE family protein [Candidatus Rokubacteria bacterium]
MDLLIAVPLGFVLGFLIGLTGVGGGALVAPALYVVLGLPYGEAVALSLIYSLFTKVVSGVQHMRQGTVLWKVTLLYGLLGIPGAILGSRLVYLADAGLQRLFPLIMGGVLLVVSALMLMETGMRSLAARPKPFSPHEVGWQGVAGIAALQLFVGVLLGITSVGAGSIIILSMVFLFRMTAREIVGSNIIIALIMVVPAGFAHYLAGGVDWRLLGLLLLGSFGGAVLGSKSTMLLPDRLLKLAMVTLIVGGALSTIAKAW